MTLLRHRRDRLHRPPPRRELLRNREGDIHVLVREGSREQLDELIAALGPAASASSPSSATCTQPQPRRRRRAGSPSTAATIDHFFHLAAIYDMTADDEHNERAQRRRHAQRRRARQRARGRASCTTSPRSPSPARYKGLFREDMFDEGQKLPSAYHRTKFESEKIAREEPTVPWRVYRPAIVVGHSQTGEMDKIDGPYYFFKAIQKAAPRAARVVPARRPRARATRTSCRSTSSPTRWTTSPTSPTSTARRSTSWPPKSQRSGEVLNTFARGRARAAARACASTSA